MWNPIQWLERPRLVRCHNCEKMIISSATECPHCHTLKKDARAFIWIARFVALLVFALISWMIIRHHHENNRLIREWEEIRQSQSPN